MNLLRAPSIASAVGGARRFRRAARVAVLAALALLPGCAGVVVTPAAIEQAPIAADERRDVVAKWREAVALANDFLASPWNRTLPRGRYELDDARGMTFVVAPGLRGAAEDRWPVIVRCTPWGDCLLPFGFAAQERTDGFVVGELGHERDRAVDNSLFRMPNDWGKPPCDVAELILHETTHAVWHDGTIGFWNGVAYYLEAIFLFRYSNHSGERRPNAIDEEFGWWQVVRERPQLDANGELRAFVEAHRREERDTCRHGPFDELPPPPPGE